MKTMIAIFVIMFVQLPKGLAQTESPAVLVEQPPQEKYRDMSLTLSFPHLLTIDRGFGIDERSYLEAFVGGLPLSSMLFLDTKLSETGYSDTHKIAYTMTAWTFSSGLRYGRYLSDTWSLLGEVALMYVHGGAQMHLKNIDNETKIPFMNVGATLVQPIFGLTVRKSWSRVTLSFSMNVFLNASLKIKKSGWFASFQEVAPEYKEAIDDGSDAAERALKSSINNLKSNFNVLPGLALSYRF